MKMIYFVLTALMAASMLLAMGASANSAEDPRLTEARTLIYEGKYAEGLTILEQILSEQPDHRDALFLKALAFEWQDEFDEALKIYRTIVSVHEDDIDAWLQIAKLEAWKGNYDDAISLYGTLISRFGEEPPIVIGLARTLSWADRLDESLLYYDRVLLQEPDNVEALAGKAQVLRWMGDARGARKIIRQAQHLDPTFPEVQKEALAVDLELKPKVLTAYSQSMEKDYLRSRNLYYYNLANRTWRSTVTFSPDVIEDLGFDVWTSRDWEIDKTLANENFNVTSIGFGARVGVRLWEPLKIGGGIRVASYRNHTTNVLFPILADEERQENFDVLLSARHNTWGADASVGTYPFFRKMINLPYIDKLEIGKQTVAHASVSKGLFKNTEGSIGYEAGDYSDGNDRSMVYGTVTVSPSSAKWISFLYNIHYQDFTMSSINYFTPLDELKHSLEADVKKSIGRTFLASGLVAGFAHSENYHDIFSGGVSGTVSRTLTDWLRLEANGFTSYDNNKYYMYAFSLGLELKL